MFSDKFLLEADPNYLLNVVRQQQVEIDELKQAIVKAQRASGLVSDIGDLDIVSNYSRSTYMLPAQTECLTDDAGGLSPYTLAAFNSGTAVSIASENNHPGIVRFTNNGNANGGGRVMLFGNTSSVLIQGGEIFEAIVRFQSFATQANYRLGFFDSANQGAEVDGAWFELVGDGSSSFAVTIKTSSNSSVTSVSPSMPAFVGTNTWYRLRIVVNEDATSVEFTLYAYSADSNLFSESITTNIPTAAGRETSCGVKAWRTNSTSTTLMEVDRVEYFNLLPIR